MLYALVLQLSTTDPCCVPRPRGHQAHALFLRLIGEVDPELAGSLHDEQGRKPFTVSLLDGGEAGNERVSLTTPTPVWLRLTILDDALIQPLAVRLSEREGSSLHLGGAPVAINRVITNPRQHRLAGSTTFERLLHEAADAPDIELEFVSPTAFSLGRLPNGRRRVALLPEPGLVFDSLRRTWNEWARPELQLDDAWRPVIEEYCLAAGYDLRTVSFTLPRHTQLGFIGRCRYRALSGDPDLRRLLHALAVFATYAGVGSKTTMGMGQVRVYRHS